ncbi:Kunitz/Bovine pancreatic trypsin inhibitor domain protein, partial [Ancylostoma duodenale]
STYATCNMMLENSVTKDLIGPGQRHMGGPPNDAPLYDPARYFYSKSFKNCMLFTYYGRDGNANNFETYNECKAMCMS